MSEPRKKLLIAIGTSCSGKTAFSKNHSKETGAEYLDFDLLYDYQKKNASQSLIEKIREIFSFSKNDSFVMDGYLIDQVPSLRNLESELSADISIALCIAAPNVIRKRQEKQRRDNPLAPEPLEKKDIKKTMEACYFALSADPRPLMIIDTTRDEFEKIEESYFPQRLRELFFISELEDMTHDKYYQDIDLPSGLKIKGYSNSEKTWERISSLVDFKDKKVVEFGSFHGFFEFRIEQAGGKRIVGVEKSEDALKVARKVAWIKNSKAVFLSGDIQHFRPKGKFDIALVLNMLHHVPDKEKALENVFGVADAIIFEIYSDQEELIEKTAERFNFEKKTVINSDRELRKIVLFQSKSSNILAVNKEAVKKFRFSKRKYLIQKALKDIKQWKILYPLKSFVKRYKEKKRGRIR